MIPPKFKSPLHEMATTTPTQFWNDSCSVNELRHAIAHGAVGATANPVICGEVLKKELTEWAEPIKRIISEMPVATEDEITWKVVEEISVSAAKLLAPIHAGGDGRKGRLSIQTDPRYFRDPARMVEQATHFDTLAPNIIVKIPVTEAGVQAIEEATYRGISINATVSFTVPQALAVGEAVEKGLKRRQAEGKEIHHMGPVCTIMVGRLDDWLKVVASRDDIVADPTHLEWAGVAVMKNAYRLYQERGYRTRLLSAATRNHMHWSEFIGGDVVVTLTHQWKRRFNESAIKVKPRINIPVDERIVQGLLSKFEDFQRAYDPEGMTVKDFDRFGATRRTLRSFIQGYHDLVGVIRDFMIEDPDR
jgi:transaldolase